MPYARMPAIFLGILFACTAQVRPQTPDTVSIMSKIEEPQIPDRGGTLIDELNARIGSVYLWDSQDKPIVR